MSTDWTRGQVPDLSGKRALVTGVTSGIGHQTAIDLAQHGAEVILGARSQEKLSETRRTLEEQVPAARFHELIVDLSELSSVRRAAAEAAALGPLHLLVNNAGVMATPFATTEDGFDLQFGTNHLGPFALTGLLFEALTASGDARVVAVSSLTHRLARHAPLGDPRLHQGRYRRNAAYARSKLANVMFTYELDRRCRERDLPVKALAAHPGYASTQLVGSGRGTSPVARAMQSVFGLLGQRPLTAALPTLMAATADLPGSTYVGPDGFLQLYGSPKVVRSSRISHDLGAQKQLWELSEQATGVHFLSP